MSAIVCAICICTFKQVRMPLNKYITWHGTRSAAVKNPYATCWHNSFNQLLLFLGTSSRGLWRSPEPAAASAAWANCCRSRGASRTAARSAAAALVANSAAAAAFLMPECALQCRWGTQSEPPPAAACSRCAAVCDAVYRRPSRVIVVHGRLFPSRPETRRAGVDGCKLGAAATSACGQR